jgi:hypothetical protein
MRHTSWLSIYNYGKKMVRSETKLTTVLLFYLVVQLAAAVAVEDRTLPVTKQYTNQHIIQHQARPNHIPSKFITRG